MKIIEDNLRTVIKINKFAKKQNAIKKYYKKTLNSRNNLIESLLPLISKERALHHKKSLMCMR
jgi:hypothetical protein